MVCNSMLGEGDETVANIFISLNRHVIRGPKSRPPYSQIQTPLLIALSLML